MVFFYRFPFVFSEKVPRAFPLWECFCPKLMSESTHGKAWNTSLPQLVIPKLYELPTNSPNVSASSQNSPRAEDYSSQPPDLLLVSKRCGGEMSLKGGVAVAWTWIFLLLFTTAVLLGEMDVQSFEGGRLLVKSWTLTGVFLKREGILLQTL